MNESLMHYFWKHKIFSILNLKTVDNHSLKIVFVGYSHQDAGPDFKQAIIKIDDITWVGNVEIHVRTSDWYKHKHQSDEKYQSIILHVVYEHDTDSINQFSTLELKQFISLSLIEEYEKLSMSEELLPCKSSLGSIGELRFASWLSRLATERLGRKQKEIFERLHQCQEDWQTAIFQLFISNFGFRTNAPAFSLLAQSLPYKWFIKHKDSRLQIYALIFGQSGMLEEEMTDDAYYLSLQSEYQYLKYKYRLLSIPSKIWNLLRLRPQNFPCVRLAQLSEVLFQMPDIVHRILNDVSSDHLRCLSGFEPHEYWKTHRHFGKESGEHSCVIGRQTADLILINTVVPAQFAYATFTGNPTLSEQSLNHLESTDFEWNSITKKYVESGFPRGNALYSQALIELHNNYCRHKRCLNCDIGCQILGRVND